MTFASKNEIKDLAREPRLHNLEDYIEEKARVQNLNKGTIYEYAPYRWFYYVLLRLIRPKVVVETGVWYGASTAFILAALEANDFGKLYSIDLPNAQYEKDDGTITTDSVGKSENTGLLVPPDLKDRWQLILGRSQERLEPLLQGLGEIDVFVHDGEHTYDAMTFEFEKAFKFLKNRGILVSDDVHLNVAFSDFSRHEHSECESFVLRRKGDGYMGIMIKSDS